MRYQKIVYISWQNIINVEHLYIIIRHGVIIHSIISEDIGHNLREESIGLKNMFDDLFIHNEVMSQSLASSSVNNSIQFYTYYVPENYNYVHEVSTGLCSLFENNYGKQVRDFPFYGSKSEIVHESNIIENFDVFNLIDEERISIIDTTLLSISQEERKDLLEKGSLTKLTSAGEEYYQVIELNKYKVGLSEKFILFINFNALTKNYCSYW